MGDHRLLRTAALALALALIGAGCGGDDGDDGGASAGTEPAGQDDGGDDGGGGGGGDIDRCPLTAEQVGDALGATVEQDVAGCSFFPPGDSTPRALFVPLPPAICDATVEEMDSRLEPFDGLGVNAYGLFAPAVPARIVVCDDVAFDLSVEISSDDAAAAAAVEDLARQILEGA